MDVRRVPGERPQALLKAALVTIAAATAVASGTSAYAQPGVDPGSVTRDADPGTSFVVDKTVRTPTIPPNPDVVLLMDTTGSMGGAITNVQDNLHEVVTDLRDAQPSAQFAVASYRDTTDGGCDSDFFVVHQDLTADEAEAQAAVDGLTAFGGCDVPEDWIYALHEVATGAITFRPGSSRMVVLIGDASSHDPSNGISLDTAVAALQAAAVRVVAVNVETGGADGLNSAGQATAVVDGTDGTFADSNPDAVTAAILAGLGNLPATVTPQATCDDGLSVSFDPTSRRVTSGTEASFTETVSVAADAAPGTRLSCTVDFRINGEPGGPAFVQTITVDVNLDDATAPVVTVDGETVEATSAAGAVIDYSASANDDVDGALTPTCEPPAGSTFPLGDTEVTCTATDSAGNTGSATATMRVVDTTAPVTACTPIIPEQYGGADPEFYVLTVEDTVDPDPTVLIRDTGSSAEFGPFPSGTTIKVVPTIGGGSPKILPSHDDTDWKVVLRGDAEIVGSDASGNVSTASCLTP